MIKEEYYDLNVELEDLFKGAASEEVFYLKDLKQRKFIINDSISQFSVADTVRHILQINREDFGIAPEERKPILLYLISVGGSVDDGFELIDVIQASKTPVYTINLGYWYSMGFLIGIAGKKRFAMKNSKFLQHDGFSGAYDSAAKMQDKLAFDKITEERIRDYVISVSNITGEEYDSKYRVEWYMYAEEAKEKGFIDYIIGEDCDIDEIV